MFGFRKRLLYTFPTDRVERLIQHVNFRHFIT